MKSLIDLCVGVFHEISGHYLILVHELKAQTEITIGPRLPVTCMFDINYAMVDGQRAGFLFTSRFETVNGGSYLMTYLHNKGAATESETLIKDEHLVVFHYPNKGTLAISPLVNPELDIVFQEQ